MGRLLLIGDSHIGKKNLPDKRHAFNQIFKIIEDEKIDYVSILGDILDITHTVEKNAFNFLVEVIEKIISYNHVKDLILHVGNHDRDDFSYCTPNHFLNPFKKYPKVTIVEKPIAKNFDHHRICLFCYLPDGRYNEAHNEFLGGDMNFTLFLSHQSFNSGLMDNGMKSKSSDKWLKDSPLQISGHFHSKHSVADNLIYIGSLTQEKHGEDPNKRVIIIDLLEDKNYKMTDIPLIPLSTYETITIDITDPPELKKNDKQRYVLVGGKINELISFGLENKKTLGAKVTYQPDVDEGDKAEILDEDLRTDIIESVGEIREETIETELKLPIPKKNLILQINHFLQLDDMEIVFSSGINKISARNGGGKTTILNAISWVLYGGISQKANVVLTAKRRWIISRSSSPKLLTVEIGDQKFTNDSAQSIINSTFGSADLWKTTSYLEQKSRCRFFSSSDKDKKDILSLIFANGQELRLITQQLDEKLSLLKKEKIDLERSLQEYNDMYDQSEFSAPELKEPDLSDIPDFDLEKPSIEDFGEIESLKKKLDKAFSNNVKYERNVFLRDEIKKLKEELPSSEDIVLAKKMSPISLQLEGLKDIPDQKDIDLDSLKSKWKKWRMFDSYQQKYTQYSPSRLEEINSLLKWRDCIEASCPSCEKMLIIDKKRNLHLSSGKIPKNFEKLEEEREILLEIKEIPSKPDMEVTIAEKINWKNSLTKTFIPGNHKEILDLAQKIKTKIAFYEEEMTPDVKMIDIEKLKEKINNMVEEKNIFERYEEKLKEKKRRTKERKTRMDNYETERIRRENLIKKQEAINKKKKTFSDKITNINDEIGKITKNSQKIKKIEAETFSKQMNIWNELFNNILQRFFDETASGKIVPYREGGKGVVEKISLEIIIDDITHKDIKTLSGGQSDLVSLSFQIALISLFNSPFKIILLDEALSQLSADRIEDKMIDALGDYLGSFFTILASHDSTELGDFIIEL